jgi:molecular chaperone GrpE
MGDMEKNETNETVVDETAENAAAEHTQPAEEAKSDKKRDSELEAVIAERDEYKDKYLRLLAEFNNYKKRTACIRSDAIKDGQCEAIEQILPVLDNLERALTHFEGDADDPMAQGVQMVHRQLLETLEKLCIKEIPALGEPFDPNLHQAVQMVEAADGQTPGNVGAVVLKGYMTDDRVIRHSMVIVNK